MNSTIDLAPSRYQASTRSRYGAAVLSALVCVGLLLVLLAMAAIHDLGRGNSTILTALKLTQPPVEDKKVVQPHKAARAPDPAQNTAPAASMKIPPHVEVNNPNKVEWPEGFIHTNHLDMANGDIAKIHSGVAPGNAQASGGGGHSMGDGPDDRGYYKADWYRKPHMSELDPFWPAEKRKTGWGMIVCRTAPNHRVEDCRELEESEHGLGLARAMRQAAGNLLVRAPKHGNEDMIGVWVTIRFDNHMIERGSEDDGLRTGESP